MPSANTVIAVGVVNRIRSYLATDETSLCAMRMTVTSLRQVTGEAIEMPETLAIVTDGEQAENCIQFVRPGRSIGVQVDLAGRPTPTMAAGRASAVYFIGRDSAVAPLSVPDEEAQAATTEAEAVPAA